MDDLSELDQAAKQVAEWTERRNALIVESRVDGWPWERIALAAGLSPGGVQKIARNAGGGELPKPRQQR